MKNYEDDSELLEDALEKFNLCEDFYSDIFMRGEDDVRFANGINQWDDRTKRKRDLDGTPSLVLNQLKPYTQQVINDIRQTRPAIRVSPVDDDADIETAQIYAGIIRNIERQSKANIAYDTAAMNAVTAGIGWIRVRVDYAHEMTFDQEIYIDRVLNFQSAMIDPAHQNLDGSDANYGFIFEDIDEEVFEEMYPDADKTGFEEGSWCSNGTIRIAEFYYKTQEKRKIYLCRYDQGGTEIEGVLTKEEKDLIEEAIGEIEVLEERETILPKIKQCTITQNEILSKTDWVGKYIPIIPVVGDEAYIDGKRQMYSLIHQAKDAQRMYNYWKSSSTAMIALQPKAPWTGAVGSFSSYPDEWAAANRQNLPFLEYDVVYDKNGNRVEPPTRQPPIQGSPAMMQEAMGAREDIRLSLGIPLSNMGEAANEISGIAVRNRQLKGDNATFHFMDNLAAAITHLGVILVDLVPKIYKRPQIRRILGEDGEPQNVPVNQPFIKEGNEYKPAKGAQDYDGVYNLSAGRYDVVCDVGASYSSQRQETADKLSELIAVQPELMGIVGDLVFKALDLPMGEEIAERIKSTLDPAMLGDDPQAEKLKQAAQMMKQLEEQVLNLDAALKDKEKNTQFEQQYKMAELDLKRKEALVDAEKTQAEIAKIQSEILLAQQNNGAINEQMAAALIDTAARVEDLSEAVNAILDYEEYRDSATEEAPITENSNE